MEEAEGTICDFSGKVSKYSMCVGGKCHENAYVHVTNFCGISSTHSMSERAGVVVKRSWASFEMLAFALEHTIYLSYEKIPVVLCQQKCLKLYFHLPDQSRLCLGSRHGKEKKRKEKKSPDTLRLC